MPLSNTHQTLLETAENFVRTRGYSAFSYGDLAKSVGIRKASIHHHFPTKADLGIALVEGYTARFHDILAKIDLEAVTAPEKLSRYIEIYKASLSDKMHCLCGMLSSDMTVLPGPVREGVTTFFVAQINWLAQTISIGQDRSEIIDELSPAQASHHLLATAQGATLLAWTLDDPSVFADAMAGVLNSFRPIE